MYCALDRTSSFGSDSTSSFGSDTSQGDTDDNASKGSQKSEPARRPSQNSLASQDPFASLTPSECTQMSAAITDMLKWKLEVENIVSYTIVTLLTDDKFGSAHRCGGPFMYAFIPLSVTFIVQSFGIYVLAQIHNDYQGESVLTHKHSPEWLIALITALTILVYAWLGHGHKEAKVLYEILFRVQALWADWYDTQKAESAQETVDVMVAQAAADGDVYLHGSAPLKGLLSKMHNISLIRKLSISWLLSALAAGLEMVITLVTLVVGARLIATSKEFNDIILNALPALFVMEIDNNVANFVFPALRYDPKRSTFRYDRKELGTCRKYCYRTLTYFGVLLQFIPATLVVALIFIPWW